MGSRHGSAVRAVQGWYGAWRANAVGATVPSGLLHSPAPAPTPGRVYRLGESSHDSTHLGTACPHPLALPRPPAYAAAALATRSVDAFFAVQCRPNGRFNGLLFSLK